MNDNSIQVENLSKNYGNFRLEHVSFQVPKGCIMGFIGENGAGKTTVIKLILNMIRKDGGSVRLFGLDPLTDEKAIKEQIGVVFDENHFHDMLKTKDIANIMRPMYKNWDDELFQRYLVKFDLPKDKTVKDFSRGMKMKLSIAVALSHHPKLLILDEATSGLDPIIRNEILDEFLEFIQNEEHSIFMSSHITGDLEKIADYITFIHQGKILLMDEKDHILEQHALLKCGTDDFSRIDKTDIIGTKKNDFGIDILIRKTPDTRRKYASFALDSVTLEDIMMFYVKGETAC